jgi:hypothetical protein
MKLEGTIIVKDGRAVGLKNISEGTLAAVPQGELSVVLSTLSSEGWALEGDYQLALTKHVETDEERKSQFESQSKSGTRGISRVTATRLRKT